MRRLIAFFSIMLAGAAQAEAPRVVADIAPVHSLVAQVMAGVGTPDLLIDPGASPHSHRLRPSQASALEAAGLVFWVGPPLTPSLERTLTTLAGAADRVMLIEVPGTRVLPFRETALFAAEEGQDGHDDHDDHGHDHDNHDKHDNQADDEHDAHAHDEGHDAHDHSGDDPHLWLNPENALVWLDAIARALAAADPANAALYRQNAEAARADLTARIATLDARMAQVSGIPFVVMHDAYQYLEDRFGLSALGAIAASDAAAPGPRRVAEVQSLLQAQGVACIFSEPQFDADRVAVLAGGSGTRVAQLDPLGAGLTPGPALYGDLLDGLSSALADCLLGI